MTNVGELNVLYIDDEAAPAQAFKEHWESILEQVYSRVNIHLSATYDSAQLRTLRPHLVIVDNVQSNSTFEEKENMGAFFIAQNKDDYSDTIFVLFTGQTFSIKTLGSVYPNPDLIIPKNSIKGKKYQTEFLVPTIKRLLRRLPIGDIIFPIHHEKIDAKPYLPEMRAILEQCTTGLVSFDSDPIDEVRLQRLTGGKSQASVYIASVAGLVRFQNVPCVFRFGKKNDIQSEVANYNLFARLQMPHNTRVELLGSGTAGAWGGALYAFALGDPAETVTATKLLQSSDEADSIALLESITAEIFGSRKVGWYNNLTDDPEKVDVFFANSEEYAPEKDTIRLARIKSAYSKHISELNFKIDSDGIIFDGKNIDLPRTLSGKFANSSIKKTICHGDLNTNNIVISNDRRRMALIDFEYTGVDHIFKDFVSLEISVRCYLETGAATDLAGLITSETVALGDFLVSGLDSISPTTTVNVIRKKFIERYSSIWDEHLAHQYALALSFHLQKVAALDGWTEQQFTRLIAAFIAVTGTLSVIEEVPKLV